MTLFITGGTSSIGRVLIKVISKIGLEVRVLVRATSDLTGLEGLPGIEFVEGDVTDINSIQKGMKNCDKVIHMAAIVGHDVPEDMWWKVNRDGTRNVLQTASDIGVKKVVQVSTMSVLGHTQPGEIADETNLPDPSVYTNLYQKTKREADDIAREFSRLGLDVSIVYPCFGYGCSWASSHPSFQEQTLLRMAGGKPVGIFGKGINVISLSYYRDKVEGIFLVLEKGESGRDYLLSGVSKTFPEIWEAVAKVLGKKPPTRRIPIRILKIITFIAKTIKGKPIFTEEFFDMIERNWYFSSERAKKELGWKSTPFLKALEETWSEYKKLGWKVQKKKM